MHIYEWLTCYLLKETYEKLQSSNLNDSDLFWAKNNSQVFLARDLSVAFIQVIVLSVTIFL